MSARMIRTNWVETLAETKNLRRSRTGYDIRKGKPRAGEPRGSTLFGRLWPAGQAALSGHAELCPRDGPGEQLCNHGHGSRGRDQFLETVDIYGARSPRTWRKDTASPSRFTRGARPRAAVASGSSWQPKSASRWIPARTTAAWSCRVTPKPGPCEPSEEKHDAERRMGWEYRVKLRSGRLSTRFWSHPFSAPSVCRLGLASYGRTDITPDDVLSAVDRGVNFLNWQGLAEGDRRRRLYCRRFFPWSRRRSIVVCARSAQGAERRRDGTSSRPSQSSGPTTSTCSPSTTSSG